MRKAVISLVLVPFIMVNILGCVALIIGGAAGALGAYAVSNDKIQGETDKPYYMLWDSALRVSRIRGIIKQEDATKGYIELQSESSKVWIRLTKLTQATTRLEVSSRKHRFPNMELAQDLFVKIMEEAK